MVVRIWRLLNLKTVICILNPDLCSIFKILNNKQTKKKYIESTTFNIQDNNIRNYNFIFFLVLEKNVFKWLGKVDTFCIESM